MKKILLILCLFPIFVFSQKSYKIPADSTILNNIGSGKNELVIRNATSNITGGILTNLGNGVTAFVLGGGSARVVDTIYKNSSKDSIVFTISGIRYAIRDSLGTGTVTSVASDITLTGTPITTSGTLRVDTTIISTKGNVTGLVQIKANQTSLNDSVTTLRNVRKVDTSYIFRNSTLDSLCQITVINGISYRSCGKDSVGAGSSTLALDKITDAVDSSTLNAGNYKQEWKWNSLANNTGFKLSSTSGGLLNTQNRLFEAEMSGAMPGTGNSSYAGYFRNTQTVGGAIGLYAEGTGTAINAVGNVRIDGGSLSLGINGAVFYRLSGNTYLQAASGEGMFLVSQGSRLINSVSGCAWGLTINKKSATEYVMGIGGVDYVSSNYRAEFTTATFIERSSDKLLFSTNSGLSGGYSTFTPTYQMSIVGSTSNVGIGTTSPVTSAALDITSTTKGFLPPRMTATQASAISSPAKGLILYSTDTNGTFTSAGLWMYNGTIWKLILAE